MIVIIIVIVMIGIIIIIIITMKIIIMIDFIIYMVIGRFCTPANCCDTWVQ